MARSKAKSTVAAARKASTKGAAKPSLKHINLALQGGGAHGAFAWGVIDRLLESGRIAIDGVVGTSAGAMNATVTAYGLAKGGPDGAREALAIFWRKISDQAKKSPLKPSFVDKLIGLGNMDYSPGYVIADALSRLMSPYQTNPMNANPLREVLLETVDFEFLHRERKVQLYVCAANVMTGRLKVFDHTEISVDAVLASGCLPFLFQAVEIDGQHYWDGGYMGNPPIFPLIYNSNTRDVLIVQLNPINIHELPTTAQSILDRVNTLSFNSSLMREMRTIHFVSGLIDRGIDDGGRMKRVLIHTIDAEDVLGRLGVSSKINADWDWLQRLFNLGRERADQFLDQHFDKIGNESSTDVAKKFL